MLYEDSALIGTAAIKNPAQTIKKQYLKRPDRIARSGHILSNSAMLQSRKAIAEMPHCPSRAMRRSSRRRALTKAMHKVLPARGFVRNGTPYEGTKHLGKQIELFLFEKQPLRH